METPRKFEWKNILFILGIIGPGVITAIADNDAGGIATYSVAGANFVLTMLWTLIPITILLIIVQEMVARLGAVTGKGLSDLIRENFGVKTTFFIMVGLLIANLFVTVSEFAGIAAAGELFGLSRIILVPFTAIIVWFLIVKMDYKKLEKIFLILILFYFAYIISGFMVKPNWGAVFKSTITPTMQFNKSFIFLIIALVGTTITPWMQFYLQSSIVEKGIRKAEYKYSRWDVIVGSSFTNIISFFIIIACAAVLFSNGIMVNDAIDAAKALEPLAGRYALYLFGGGFFIAALFGAFIFPLSTSYYLCEAFGWESGVNKKFGNAKNFYIIILFMIILSAGIVLIPSINLIYLILLAQFINGLILPVLIIIILKLINDRKLMGSYANKRWVNMITWTGCALIIIASLSMLVVTIIGP